MILAYVNFETGYWARYSGRTRVMYGTLKTSPREFDWRYAVQALRLRPWEIDPSYPKDAA